MTEDQAWLAGGAGALALSLLHLAVAGSVLAWNAEPGSLIARVGTVLNWGVRGGYVVYLAGVAPVLFVAGYRVGERGGLEGLWAIFLMNAAMAALAYGLVGLVTAFTLPPRWRHRPEAAEPPPPSDGFWGGWYAGFCLLLELPLVVGLFASS